MPGEQIEQYELWIYDTREKDLFQVSAEKWADQTIDQIQWSPDSKTAYFQRMSRDWMSLDLCSLNPSNGTCNVLIEERGKRQVITGSPQYLGADHYPYHILKTTNEMIWFSWRDGWHHFYLYDSNGEFKTQITKGNYNVGKLLKIDEMNRVIYFLGNAKEPIRNPYYHHLYRAGFDGNNLVLLTPEDAEHEIYFSETGNYFVDNYSRADLPPKTVVRNSDGDMMMQLEHADITLLEEEGWKRPEIFHVKAADDSTDLWGVMFKPYDFNPAKKYPIVTYGYPGKESEFLPWRFCHNAWVGAIATSLAQYGFIVVVAGNRGGSPERSYSYYNFGEDHFRDYPIADKKIVVERLAEKYAYIDIDRVGVMGQSSGGFLAASAILLEPDFFKVAVAKCGPQNPALYYHHWFERYSNITDSKKIITAQNSNNAIVNNLKGRLLLVQGDMDLHMPPSLTYRLAYDLMMANKRFDTFVIPKADHFWGDNYPYVIKYMELYFVENLLGDNTFNVNMFEK
jgi:dipeptidyl aminopeptidase/acylaminoacyl peptidase